MKKLYLWFLFFPLLCKPVLAQSDPVQNTLTAFPYQKAADVQTALSTMQTWDKANWKKLLSLLESADTSLQVKASYAVQAYVNHTSQIAEAKKQMTEHLIAGLGSMKKNESRVFIITNLGLLGDDAAVKPLAKLLNDKTLAGNAARALAAIHSDASMAALTAALPKASETNRKHIQSALDNARLVLPEIKRAVTASRPAVAQNKVQQLLQLQQQMDDAKNPLQKKAILAEAARIPGFNSLMFVSHFLEDAELSADAATISARMALANKHLTGEAVRNVLEKALPLVRGADSAFLVTQLRPHVAAMPRDHGFVSLFNGKDLTGWKALIGNPISRAKMKPAELAAQQKAADEKAKTDWIVKDGLLVFTGHGDNLATTKQYGDFELFVDWKITEQGDAGIYLRGTPQVQIWDTSRHDVGAQVGSGGLYNNQKNPSKPLTVADNKIGEWNTFHIIMKGDKVTVYLNGVLVTDNVTLENYWDKNQPIFLKEQIELQAHGTYVAYRNIYLKDLSGQITPLSEAEKKQGFTMLFDGTSMNHWTGDTTNYRLEDGMIVVHPEGHGAGNLYTQDEYADFEYRFEFQLTAGANNGLGIRAPLEGDAAYVGMELQILDNDAEKYKDLKPYQYHGSVYGVIPAKRGHLLPTGEWNKETVIVKGNKVKVILNGTVILDGDIKEAAKNGTLDHQQHPGLLRKTGHIGFLGHGDVVRFRNIRIKRL